MKKLTDFQLVELAKGGNQRAFTILRNRYWGYVRNKMFLMSRNYEDAKDLTAVAFGKALTSINSYSPTYAFSTWLNAIAYNNAIDFIRIRKAKKIHIPLESTIYDEGLTLSEVLPTTIQTAEEEITRAETASGLLRCVNKLPELEREIIRLRYFEDLQYEEIAESLSLPLGTVKGMLFRAKGRLKQIFLKAGGEKLKSVPITNEMRVSARKRYFQEYTRKTIINRKIKAA